MALGASILAVKLGDLFHAVPASTLNTISAELKLVMTSQALVTLDAIVIFWYVEAISASTADLGVCIAIDAVGHTCDLFACATDLSGGVEFVAGGAVKAFWHLS